MKERLFQLIESLNLTNVQFADAIGIERSTLSHIKTERSKPSLELIYKIMKQYPEVNLEWLILGEGSMRHQSGDSREPNLFDQEIIEPNSAKAMDPVVSIPSPKAPEPILSVPTSSLKEEVKSVVNPSLEKRIERILVFYSDKTFDEYLK